VFGLGDACGECTTENNLEFREGHSVSSRFGVLEKRALADASPEPCRMFPDNAYLSLNSPIYMTRDVSISE
jgi:hypothetical protein